MTVAEYTRLTAQIAVLKEVAMAYPTKTIENIIMQMEARRKEIAMEYSCKTIDNIIVQMEARKKEIDNSAEKQ